MQERVGSLVLTCQASQCSKHFKQITSKLLAVYYPLLLTWYVHLISRRDVGFQMRLKPFRLFEKNWNFMILSVVKSADKFTMRMCAYVVGCLDGMREARSGMEIKQTKLLSLVPEYISENNLSLFEIKHFSRWKNKNVQQVMKVSYIS